MTDPIEWLASMLIVEAVRSQLLTRRLLPDHHDPEVRAAALEVWERGWAMRHGPAGWKHRPIRAGGGYVRGRALRDVWSGQLVTTEDVDLADSCRQGA